MFRTNLVFYNKIFRRSIFISSAIVTPSIIVDNAGISKTERSESPLTKTEKETGWDRLRKMYSFDEWGNMSKEMNAVCQTAFISCFIGACYGGFKYSRVAFLDFMERNEATKFSNHLEAKRRLQNHVTINFGRGAFKWSWRLTLFCGLFTLVLTSASTYRGYTSVFDYIAGGIAAGSFYQFKVGPRGMIVGATLGGMLGLLGGSISQTLLGLTDSSFEEVIAWQNKFDESRTGQMKSAERKHAESLLEGKTKLIELHEEAQDIKQE